MALSPSSAAPTGVPSCCRRVCCACGPRTNHSRNANTCRICCWTLRATRACGLLAPAACARAARVLLLRPRLPAGVAGVLRCKLPRTMKHSNCTRSAHIASRSPASAPLLVSAEVGAAAADLKIVKVTGFPVTLHCWLEQARNPSTWPLCLQCFHFETWLSYYTCSGHPYTCLEHNSTHS